MSDESSRSYSFNHFEAQRREEDLEFFKPRADQVNIENISETHQVDQHVR
jgi:hypothetical protein